LSALLLLAADDNEEEEEEDEEDADDEDEAPVEGSLGFLWRRIPTACVHSSLTSASLSSDIIIVDSTESPTFTSLNALWGSTVSAAAAAAAVAVASVGAIKAEAVASVGAIKAAMVAGVVAAVEVVT
jgi:hypothetical protein